MRSAGYHVRGSHFRLFYGGVIDPSYFDLDTADPTPAGTGDDGWTGRDFKYYKTIYEFNES